MSVAVEPVIGPCQQRFIGLDISDFVFHRKSLITFSVSGGWPDKRESYHQYPLRARRPSAPIGYAAVFALLRLTRIIAAKIKAIIEHSMTFSNADDTDDSCSLLSNSTSSLLQNLVSSSQISFEYPSTKII